MPLFSLYMMRLPFSGIPRCGRKRCMAAGLFGILLFLYGCGNQKTESGLNDEITASRQNAITRTVNEVSGSVVGVLISGRENVGFNNPQSLLEYFLFPDMASRQASRIGSGFIVTEQGHVVTNQHVVGNAPESIEILMAGGQRYEAEIVGTDEYTNVALLRILAAGGQSFRPVTFGDSDAAIPGEWVIAAGNASGLFEDGRPSLTVGVVSAVNRNFRPDPQEPRVYLNMIQTDAAINRENSGGPLLNAAGEVIGVNTFIEGRSGGRASSGMNFAIPVNRMQQIIAQLNETGAVALSYDPGMEVVSVSPQLAYEYQLPYMQGLLVVSVNQDGPAFEAGVLPGDIITRIGREMVYGQIHAMALFRKYSEGDAMRLEILREGQRYETRMLLRRQAPPKP